VVCTASWSSPAAASLAGAGDYRLFIGTYTGPKSKGVYCSHFDSANGKLTPAELAAEIRNPSFLAIHPNQHWLYAVSEVESAGGKPGGRVASFRVDSATGKLTLLNEQASGGGAPCHLALDQTGKYLLVANYSSGTLSALPVRSDGSLGEVTTTIQHRGHGPNSARQAGPHAHFITSDPANRFVLACDLGLDQVLVYRFDPASKEILRPDDPPHASLKPGSGPRHLAFHPNGKWVYVVNELDSTVSAFRYEADRGEMTDLQSVSTLPDQFAGENNCAEVAVHPSGKFVYASNRGHDSVAAFAVDSGTGELRRTEITPTQGKTPRHFAIDPTGRWLLVENQNSNSIVVFRIDAATGKLSPAGAPFDLGAPVCAIFAPILP
jgi:6-phosphogluconolactonase